MNIGGRGMSFLEKYYHRREKRSKRIYEIDDDLYSGLERLSEIYEASVTELVNAAIEFIIKTENVALFQKEEAGLPVKHSLMIRESNLSGLDMLKDKYGVSIYKLVNIAIKNLLEDSILYGGE